MLKIALLLMSGNALTSLILLVRNLTIANLISLENYGVAATFAIVMTVVEIASNLGLHQQIIQAKHGDDEKFQAALQGFQLLRGSVSAVLLLAFADQLANFMGVPEAAWAYQILALVPILNALVHFDIYRLNRTMNFLPLVLSGMLPALLSLISISPLALYFIDYRLMLYAIIVQVILSVVISHILARRRYRVSLDRRIIYQSVNFGWPLLVNGLLLFAVFQGDKIVIGSELGMEALAIFAMGFTLTLTPALVMANSSQKLFLPVLSAIDFLTEDGRSKFQLVSEVAIQVSILYGVVLVFMVWMLGESFVVVLLGKDFVSLVPLLVPLAVMQALRIARTGTSIIAISRSHTDNDMWSNALRVAALPISWFIITTLGADLTLVVGVAIIGEALGSALSAFLVTRKPGISLRAVIIPTIISTVFIFLALSASLFDIFPTTVTASILIVLIILLIVSSKELITYFRTRSSV